MAGGSLYLLPANFFYIKEFILNNILKEEFEGLFRLQEASKSSLTLSTKGGVNDIKPLLEAFSEEGFKLTLTDLGERKKSFFLNGEKVPLIKNKDLGDYTPKNLGSPVSYSFKDLCLFDKERKQFYSLESLLIAYENCRKKETLKNGKPKVCSYKFIRDSGAKALTKNPKSFLQVLFVVKSNGTFFWNRRLSPLNLEMKGFSVKIVNSYLSIKKGDLNYFITGSNLENKDFQESPFIKKDASNPGLGIAQMDYLPFFKKSNSEETGTFLYPGILPDKEYSGNIEGIEVQDLTKGKIPEPFKSFLDWGTTLEGSILVGGLNSNNFEDFLKSLSSSKNESTGIFSSSWWKSYEEALRRMKSLKQKEEDKEVMLSVTAFTDKETEGFIGLHKMYSLLDEEPKTDIAFIYPQSKTFKFADVLITKGGQSYGISAKVDEGQKSSLLAYLDESFLQQIKDQILGEDSNKEIDYKTFLEAFFKTLNSNMQVEPGLNIEVLGSKGLDQKDYTSLIRDLEKVDDLEKVENSSKVKLNLNKVEAEKLSLYFIDTFLRKPSKNSETFNFKVFEKSFSYLRDRLEEDIKLSNNIKDYSNLGAYDFIKNSKGEAKKWTFKLSRNILENLFSKALEVSKVDTLIKICVIKKLSPENLSLSKVHLNSLTGELTSEDYSKIATQNQDLKAILDNPTLVDEIYKLFDIASANNAEKTRFLYKVTKKDEDSGKDISKVFAFYAGNAKGSAIGMQTHKKTDTEQTFSEFTGSTLKNFQISKESISGILKK